MNKIIRYTIYSALFFILVSCGGGSEKNSPEIFEGDGSPEFVQNVDEDYYFCEPWSYNNAANSEYKYPLFVYLHGSGSSGTPSILPCLNNDIDKKRYPAFVYIPHNWSNSDVIAHIELFKSQYRIDTDRIYLMGYSMGGSGSYSLANAYYDSVYKQLFAGIVRMAGQSQTVVRNAIADKTSIWYHVGLSDTETRVQVAKDSYKFLKDYPGNSGAVESTEPVTIDGYPGTTYTLTKGGIEIVKYTEYDSPVGHGVSHFPLKDPYLLEWLFSQSLKNR